MKLSVREAAALLSVSESDLYRWVGSGDIPHYSVNNQPLFSRAELLEWALARGRPVSIGLFEDGDEGPAPLRLTEALECGGIHHRVPGSDRASVLRTIVDRLPIPDEQDRDLVVHVLLAREAMGSTGIGEGIAIPHVRSPLVFPGTRGALSLSFLQTPIAFEAIDQQPVHTIFMALTPTIRCHLQLLSRLSLALHDSGFGSAVASRATREELMAHARRVDDSLARRSRGPG